MKPLPIKSCSAIAKLYSMHWPSSVQYAARNGSNYGPEPTKVRAAEWMLRELEKALKEDEVTHESNNEALTNNLSIQHRVEEVMKEIGMPTTYSERDMTSRKREKPWVTKSAGYKGDLVRHVKVNDNWVWSQEQHAKLKSTYEARLKEAQQEEAAAKAKAEREAGAELEKRKAVMKLAVIIARYSLPIESTWDDVLEALLAKSGRLALAVAMEQVRSDWNDGPKPVRYALYDPGDDPTDKAIIADVEECLDNWDGDGRIFRDTTWNYGAIYASIDDQQLVADAQEALAESAR